MWALIVLMLLNYINYLKSQTTIKRLFHYAFSNLFMSTKILPKRTNSHHRAIFQDQIAKRKSKSGNLSQPPSNLKF